MTSKRLRISFLAAFALFGLGACGGSETTAGGGIGGTGISYGTVTDFGSIWVNGVRFNTNGATIVKDDVGISETELRRGMTVEVSGFIDYNAPTGTANTVTVEEAVRGPVESQPSGTASAGTLVVLGQTVQVDDTTLVDNNVCEAGEACATVAQRFAAMGTGDLLEVHGHRRTDGTIAATFIERKTGPVAFAVRGTVTDHDAVAQTFMIGGLRVNYAGVIVGDMPAPSGSNWNDLFVEAKGTECAANPICGTLTATKVEPEGLAVVDAARAEIEGFVTAVTSPTQFTVGNQEVVVTASTIFAGGLASDIVVGAKLEAEGTLAGGILTATKISFRDNVRLESDVETADAGAGTLTLKGLPGITISVNQQTEFDNVSGIVGIKANDHVRIPGRATGTNAVIATRFELRDPDDDVVLQGPIQSFVNLISVTILDITVGTDGLEFEGIDDTLISASDFFNALTVGTLVKVQGILVDSTVTWDEIELED